MLYTAATWAWFISTDLCHKKPLDYSLLIPNRQLDVRLSYSALHVKVKIVMMSFYFLAVLDLRSPGKQNFHLKLSYGTKNTDYTIS